MSLVNSTSIFGTMFTQTTSTITGSASVTVLLMLILIFAICVGLSIPLDLAILVMLPFALIMFMVAGQSIGGIILVFIFYAGWMLTKMLLRMIG